MSEPPRRRLWVKRCPNSDRVDRTADSKASHPIHYEAILREHIARNWAGSRANLTPATIRNWYSVTLVDRPTYRAHSYGLLKSILETAMKDGLLSANPCQINGAGSVRSKTQAVIPTVEQLTEIADKIEPKFKALILICAWCGLRFGEVTELRRKDFGISKRMITRNHFGCARRDSPKRQRSRVGRCTNRHAQMREGTQLWLIPPHIRAEVQAHLDEYVEREPNSLLFVPVRGGCHLSPITLCATPFVPALQIHWAAT